MMFEGVPGSGSESLPKIVVDHEQRASLTDDDNDDDDNNDDVQTLMDLSVL